MTIKEDEFLDELRAMFKIEAAEHLQEMATGLLELEKTTTPEAQRDLVTIVFRAAHSLKGAARAVDFIEIESHCESLEDLFAAWKREESVPSPAAFDTAHQALDAITEAMAAPEPGVVVREPAIEVPAVQVEDAPVEAAAPLAHPDEAVEAVEAALATGHDSLASTDTVRIAVAKLDARLVEAEEMVTAKLTAAQRAQDLRELGQRFEGWRQAWADVEPQARALGHAATTNGHAAGAKSLSGVLAFLEWNRDYLKSMESDVATLARTVEQDRHAIGKLVDELLEGSKNLLLLPFSTISVSYPKLVRDLCADLGKDADLVVRGDEVEVDKRILEEMKDPIIHLLRNCIDHGVERPEERARLGKPARATITLAMSQVSGSKVEILLSDDGAGVDTEKVKESAVKHRFLVVDAARRLSDEEAQALIFKEEVSTSPIITQLSGRGLGMTIVREKAQRLGGTVSVESRPEHGTTFRIVLPATLATFRGILIELAGQVFVVPTAHVERVAGMKAREVQTVEGRDTITVGGQAIPLVWLTDVLSLPASVTDEASASSPVVVLGVGDLRIAFVVDAVLDEQEVLVKPLPKPLSRVRNIAGATVLGSGQVALILNASDLVKSARKMGGRTARVVAPKPVEVKSVLVAEDSATSRMLIKGILESAGYDVSTAVDGMDAFTLLRAERFDLLVSDVEMPRLNGLDLTARIRADKKLAELPVVLVTALETREDRERGIEVGANAYIVKSSLDQSNLLDAVRRLL